MRSRRVYCVFNHQMVVNSSLCGQDMPSTEEPCNPHDCPTWTADEWTHCSCETGLRSRKIRCQYQGNQISLDKCEQTLRPNETEACTPMDCPIWKSQPWGPCSATCDNGIKTRDIYCAIEYRSVATNIILDKHVENSQCNQAIKPINVSKCTVEQECFEWRTSYWSACSVTCGQGIRMRRVHCSGQPGDCTLESKPAHVEQCNMQPCSAEWQVGEWSKVKYVSFLNKSIIFINI